jgi:hypothetical protein
MRWISQSMDQSVNQSIASYQSNQSNNQINQTMGVPSHRFVSLRVTSCRLCLSLVQWISQCLSLVQWISQSIASYETMKQTLGVASCGVASLRVASCRFVPSCRSQSVNRFLASYQSVNRCISRISQSIASCQTMGIASLRVASSLHRFMSPLSCGVSSVQWISQSITS